MRIGEQVAHLEHSIVSQVIDGSGEAVVLGDHVTGPTAQLPVGQPGQSGGQIVDGDVTQGGDAEDLGGEFAGGAPCGVLAVGQRMRNPGVDDQDGKAAGGRIERNVLPPR